MGEARGLGAPPRDEILDSALRTQLDNALEASIQEMLGEPAPIGVLFSGGLDSSFLAVFLSERWPVTLETVGVAGSSDLRAAHEGAELLRLPWNFHEIQINDVRAFQLEFRSELQGLREPRRSVAVAFGLAVEKASALHLVCGQGADELFLGYAHYRGKAVSARRTLRQEDLDRLLQEDWPLAQRFAQACGRTIAAPLLDPRMIDLILRLPDRFIAESPETKPLLRAWARAHGLPEPLAGRPKQALQYGSGISKIVEREDRRALTLNR